MPGKLNVYGLGSLGVNVDKNPLNLEDGELTKAQNAIHDPTGSMGGIRKRPGLTKVNGSAVTGSVFGIMNVPIAPITVRRFFVGIDQGVTASYQWVNSTDGFVNTSTATSPSAIMNPSNELHDGSGRWGELISSRGYSDDGLLIYVGTYTRGQPIIVRGWDGTQDVELFRIPLITTATAWATQSQIDGSKGSIRQFLKDGTKLYMVVHEFYHSGATFVSVSRIMCYDFANGSLTQIGEASDGVVTADLGDGGVGFTCIELHQGYLYAGVGSVDNANDTDAGIYRIRPGVDTSWTLDYTAGTNEVPLCLKSYKGLLYAGMTDYDAAAAPMKVRSAAGAWSNSTTVGGANANNMWITMEVFGDNLYACSKDAAGGVSNVGRIHKFDGSSWSTVKTIQTAADPKVGVAMIVHDSVLYVLCKNVAKAGQVSYSTDGSSWTDQTTNLTSAVSCVFGVLTD